MSDATGRVAITALILACGASDDEVYAVAEKLAPIIPPDDITMMIKQVRTAIAQLRYGGG